MISVSNPPEHFKEYEKGRFSSSWNKFWPKSYYQVPVLTAHPILLPFASSFFVLLGHHAVPIVVVVGFDDDDDDDDGPPGSCVDSDSTTTNASQAEPAAPFPSPPSPSSSLQKGPCFYMDDESYR
jgi:hypothetical protein